MDVFEDKKELEPSLSKRHKLMMQPEEDMERKYQSKRPTQEARIDALTYAASQLDWHKIQSFVVPDLGQEDIEFADKTTKQWENAIDDARKGEWATTQTVLQIYARDCYASATIKESWRERDPRFSSGGEDERRADAFINLIRSLQ